MECIGGIWCIVFHTHSLFTFQKLFAVNGFSGNSSPRILGMTFFLYFIMEYSKICVKRSLKDKRNKDFNDKWLLNESRKYCRMSILQYF